MATIVTFKACGQYVRNAYLKSSDARHLTADEKKEILSYSNISREFEYDDWFGSSNLVIATLVNVKENDWGDLLFTVSVNRNIPKHYVPSPSDILRDQDLLFPVGYSRI